MPVNPVVENEAMETPQVNAIQNVVDLSADVNICIAVAAARR